LAHEFAPQVEQKALTFKLDVEDVTVASDPVLLDRILRNLLTNALRYTEHGEIRLSAHITARSNDSSDATSNTRSLRFGHDHQPSSASGQVLLRVEDTGVGIAANEQLHVFEEYRQLHTTSDEDEQGLGLGLSIVRRFCALLDMPLELESSPGIGSVFRLSLPLLECQPTPVRPESEPWEWHNILVLLVDDERQVRDAMVRRLRDWGCQVVAAASAQEAVYRCAIAARDPDILLCDYRLGGGESGLDVVHALREGSTTPLPTLLITGDTSSECLRKAACYALPVIHKPVDEKDLMTSMRLCLAATQTPDSMISINHSFADCAAS